MIESKHVCGEGEQSSFDPLLGTWATMMPLIGRVGSIVRRIRADKETETLSDLITSIEASLIEWKHPCPQARENQAEMSEVCESAGNELYCVAEAYRISTLVTLYSYSPGLCSKRAGLFEAPSEFLDRLARSAISLLKQVPIDSRLWRVCSIPILCAGQLITGPSDRDFLRLMKDRLAQKIQVSAVSKVRELLEEVWRRRDTGQPAWWIDVLDEAGNPILVN